MSAATLTPAQHARAVLVLGLPLIGSHLAQFAVGVTDSIMLGWYAVEDLAAATLGGSFFFVFLIFGSGFAWAVMPVVAAAAASGDTREVRRVTRMALWLSMLFACAALPFFIFSEQVLRAIGQTDDLAQRASSYLRIFGWSLFPALVVMVLKSYLAALGRTQVVLWVTVGAAVLNGVLNWVLIFGNLGAPELGIRGAAIASVCLHVFSMVALATYAATVTREHQLFVRLWRPDWPAFRRIFALGWPIGVTSLAEVGLFAASAVMIGWIGAIELAAHGIALQLASATFMLHLGLSNAATIRAGHAHGRGDRGDLRGGAAAAIGLSALGVAGTVILFLTVPEALIGLFLDPADPNRAAVIAAGITLVALAALFQTADAAQVMALGLLRGVQDTRRPMVYAAVSYWAVGMPCSYVLGFPLGFGAPGVWVGLVVGLTVAAVLLMHRFWTGAGRVPI
jgi:MATE family multidrug resistance protein